MNARARGFTLVELMVALTGGLMFSVFVFTLSRDVTRFFRQEAGLSDATTAILTGYQRLRADVQRAGFLASPNLAKDLGRCPARPTPDQTFNLASLTGGQWAVYDHMRNLALARVTTGATTSTWLTANSLAPDQLILYGNYITADQYPVRSYGTNIIYLDPNSEELARAGYSTTDPTVAANTLAFIFPAGTILRVVSADTGEEQYTVVQNTAAAAATSPVINYVAAAPLIAKAGGSSCGIRGLGADLLVNPVNIIQYRLGTLASVAGYAGIYATSGAESAWPRLDLLREQLDPRAAIAAPISQELVAEFAVDFKVGVQAVTNTTTMVTSFYQAGDTEFAAYTGPSTATASTDPNKGPHMIRALRPRLAVRSRAPDRQANVQGGAGLYRVPLNAATGGAGPGDYARVRTLQSLIMTRNTRNRVWN